MSTDAATSSYGSAQTGSISTMGAGDSHAFSANDVHQGNVGDCYFLSSLMAIAARNPGLLSAAFSAQNADGTYDVRIYRRQGGFLGIGASLQPTIVKVLPTFPQQGGTGRNTYAHGGDRNAAGQEELWVKLFEKAWAMVNGSFDAIHFGYEEAALEALTGQEQSYHGIDSGFLGIGGMNDTQLATAVVAAITAGHAVTCSTRSQADINGLAPADVAFAQTNSIVGAHAYAIMSATAANVELRNPWGDAATGGAAAVPQFTLTWAQFRKYYTGYTTQD